MLLVGHVTKDGALAGPRALEHVVDTVLSFEGDRHHALRMLRALKHRFGATDELGLMEMTEAGLVAGRRSERALPRRPAARARRARSSTCVIEGSRPLCVEVQALVSSTTRAVPAPGRRRRSTASRLAMLARGAASSAPASQLDNCDVYASIAGGVRVAEPGADLAVALAIAGARNGAVDRT